MTVFNSQKQSGEISRSALEKMADNDIEFTPKNYEIWYNYVLGENLLLVKELSNIINAKVIFDEIRNEEIYQKYFGHYQGTGEIQETCSRIEASVSDILKQIGFVRSSNTDYKHKLVDISDEISESVSVRDLSATIERLASSTESIIHSSQRIELKLSESSSGISELSRHLKELRQEVLSDNLTGIANRKLFDLKLRDELMNSRETGNKVSLIFMDIDDFKKFNDSYGHLIGDQILKITANLLKDNVKGQDLAARYGGEEFCILLPDTALMDAVALAKQIGQRLANREINNKRTRETYGRITLSTGVAEYRVGETSDDLIRRADEAHYQAKQHGRNRVEIAAERELEETVTV
jgi:diguanylate cyclase